MTSSSWEPFGAARRLAEKGEGAPPGSAPPSPPPAASAPTPPAPGSLAREPARRLVVITCMDARIEPLSLLGLRLGDAHVIRNAGATISDDVLRSLRASQSLLGTRRALVIGHTDCAGHPSDEAAEAAVADGLRRIRSSSAVPDSFGLEGLMYDVRTGELRPIAG
jgi:carbonic anhydrase